MKINLENGFFYLLIDPIFFIAASGVRHEF